jgi:hypothetical protein
MAMVSTPVMLSFSQVKSLLFLFLDPTLEFFQVPGLEWSNRMHSDAFKKSSVFYAEVLKDLVRVVLSVRLRA